MAVRDEGEICNCRVNVRGNPHQLGAEAPRGFLSVIGGGTSPGTNESGRRELAAWIVDPANPLPARVFVNRVWMHLFGEGLVRSVDNFGLQGERPTHPELLDALAAEFLADGGSLKRLVRRLTLTAAYAQSAGGDPARLKADPENRLLGRMNRRRLEAEALRDAMLAVSRRLDPSPGGSAVTSLGEAAIDNDSKGGTNVDRSLRRSIYLPVLRNELPPLFETFDFADPDVSTGKRDVTTVPTQALYLLNSPFVREQARLAAEDLLRSPGDDAGRVKELYRRCFSRAPSEQELAAALSFLGAQPERKLGAKAPDRTRTWTALVQAAFGATEFRLLD
ncbi:MAG TPA: DUF1553 domain-containing protein, partial [Planctomycetia bacterium]|nr:DUF1553 domain-containing protein [Planctomycetia bacterium]